MVMIDSWGTELIDDYSKLIKSFGLQPLDKTLLKKFPKPNRLMRRQIAFGGTDLDKIANAIKSKKPFYVLTGIMPTADRIHFGTKSVIENVKYFQDRGAKTYVLVADLESSATREISLEEGKKRALNFYIPAYIALGLDPKKTIFYFQSENNWVRNSAYEFAPRATLNEYKAIYGTPHPSRILVSLLQAADILYPQEKKEMLGIIPVGADQAPHIRLTRDIVKRVKKRKFISPAAMYHKFVPSLDGASKMSKSNPNAMISIPENIKTAKKKIMRAFTGGRETVEIQKKKGGRPEICMVFELEKQHLIEDDKELQKIYSDCKEGKLLCGEHKQKTCEHLEKFMKDFEKKFKKAKKVKVKFAE